jgi:hypothetical protein
MEAFLDPEYASTADGEETAAWADQIEEPRQPDRC